MDKNIPQYRIGEFAKYLGVTPDLLKHYEDMEIIRSERAENGYRYYPFTLTPTLFECIRLQNLGMTLREISDLLCGKSENGPAAELNVNRHVQELRKRLHHENALVEAYDHFLQWKALMGNKSFGWYILPSDEIYFLPHTEEKTFIEDSDIQTIIHSWVTELPIVKPALKVQKNGSKIWGLMVSAADADQLDIPINSKVEKLPSVKTFFYQYTGCVIPLSGEKLNNPQHPAMKLFQSMNLIPENYYLRITMGPRYTSNGLRDQYGYYAIPIHEC